MVKVNKLFLILLGCVMMGGAVASANELHIFAPGYQMRYENDADQTIKNRQYANYNLAAVIFSDYLIGAEFNQRSDDSGNPSLNIKTEFQEFNLYAGYFIYSKLLNADYKIVFDIGPVAYLGQNRTTVETNLGSSSSQAAGEDSLVYALGIQGTLRLSALIIQAESRYAYSRSYEPSYTPVYGIRLGFRIGL